MKKILIIIALSLPACTGMVGSTYQGKMVIYDQDKVVRGTPAYVGSQMADFEKGKALAVLYQELAQEENPQRVKLLIKKIKNLTSPKQRAKTTRRKSRESRFTY